MFIHECLSNDFPTFSLQESAKEAYTVAKEYQHTHVFIIENDRLFGNISIDELTHAEHETLKDYQEEIEKFAILETESIMNSIPLFNRFMCNIIPILDENERYLGYILADDVFHQLSKSALFGEKGVTLIIQHNDLHFSLAEVTRIVESNNAKVYGCYISEMFDNYVHITLKISEHNLGFIREDFSRYGYDIVHQFYTDQKQELLKNRFDFVQKYLEI